MGSDVMTAHEIKSDGVTLREWRIDGDAMPSELGEMLSAEAVFFNTKHWGDDADGSLVICISCSDLFSWGCADAETAMLTDWPELTRCWKLHGEEGLHAWCVQKRNIRPQQPVLDRTDFMKVWADCYPDKPLPEKAND